MRHISGNPNVGLTGIGQGRIYAICTDDKNVKSGTAFSIEDLVFAKNESGLSFGLGTVAALIMKAAAGEKTTWRFVVCFYRDGIVTAGMNATYYYTKFFSSIEDVASYGLVHFDIYKENALESNNIAGFCSLSDDRKFMLAHAIRSYYGSTELLLAENKPLWIVNEGEYRMINTFDLAVDHLFYEVKKNPWTVKNVLDTYTRFYSYYDTISLPDSKTCSAGIGFTHDMGVANTFSPHHHSVYELPGLQGCFSYMTHEQLVNWILCAGVYCATTCDTVWLHSNRAVIEACFESMLNRDHPDPLKRDGIMDFDSSRAGKGSEITTYDNVDSSLGQARRNAYLAVKCWAAYLSLSFLFRSLENGKSAEDAIMQADLCADTICSFRRSDGTIPALLQDDNNSMLIPIIEGLVFPYFFNKEMVDNAGRYGELIDLLTAHCRAVLKKGVCIFDDGGWRLSSTSKNSWLSKIYLCQFVTEKILCIDADSEADRTHVQWLLNENNSYYAWSDQMLEGIVCGSRYYPRGVTSVLWLK
jgi:hypothetical protein